jgi:glycosyltransferase involved in cell wall biosynthesis
LLLRLYTIGMTTLSLDLAIIVHDLSATGVARNAVRIAAGMAERGLSTELWVIDANGPFRERVPANVAVRTLWEGQRLPFRRLEVFLSKSRIANEIRARQPRVILSAGNHIHWAAGPAYARAGRPARTLFMGRSSNAPPLRSLPLIGVLAQAWDARKYEEMHTIIAVSHELADLLIHQLGLPATKVVTIPNGVDLSAIEAQAAKPLDDPWFSSGSPPVIVGAGRLSRQKNFPLLIEAFALLRKEQDARLMILGDGSPDARRRLEGLAVRLGVAQDVRLAGYIDNPMRFFSRAGLFVLSSLWEGASNVLLEAMACGCPVVATDCPTGVKEQLDHGRIGPIVPMNDASALARAMRMRLNAPRDSEMLRTQAGRYRQDEILERYFKLLSSA